MNKPTGEPDFGHSQAGCGPRAASWIVLLYSFSAQLFYFILFLLVLLKKIFKTLF